MAPETLQMLTVFVLVGAMAGSSGAFTAKPLDSEDPRAAWIETASHAVRGVVTKIEATFLVLRTTTSRPIDLPFVLTPATLREGAITIGSTVSVRYRIEANRRVAIAVTVRVTKLMSPKGN